MVECASSDGRVLPIAEKLLIDDHQPAVLIASSVGQCDIREKEPWGKIGVEQCAKQDIRQFSELIKLSAKGKRGVAPPHHFDDRAQKCLTLPSTALCFESTEF